MIVLKVYFQRDHSQQVFLLQIGKWTVCITNYNYGDENVISQVESTATRMDASTYNKELLPITVKTDIYNKSPSFNNRQGEYVLSPQILQSGVS